VARAVERPESRRQPVMGRRSAFNPVPTPREEYRPITAGWTGWETDSRALTWECREF